MHRNNILPKEVIYCLIRFPHEKKWDVVRKNALKHFDENNETAVANYKSKNYQVDIIVTGKFSFETFLAYFIHLSIKIICLSISNTFFKKYFYSYLFHHMA